VQEAGSPPPPGQLSPDGMWRWDGSQWQAVMPAPQPASAAKAERSWFATGGGMIALVGVPFILAGCIFPFVYYTDTSNGGPTSASVFNLGYSGGLFYALEPVVVMLSVASAAIFLIAWQHRIVRAVGAGVLVAIGVQTASLFVGYVGGSTAYGRLGLGGALGLIGGVFVLVGGCLVAAGLFVRRPT
jgi:hypothetical protein